MGIKWIEIFLWYRCNLNCVFCFQKNLRKTEKNNIDYLKVKKIIDDWSENWKKSIIFSWWEPLLDKNIFDYISFAKQKGYTDIRIHSNWLILSKKEIFEQYILSWVNAFIVSIHWYWEVHDISVRSKWAFDKIKITLINFLELKKKYNYLVLDTNTVLTKYNYNTLDKLFKFLSFFPITRSQLVQLYSLWLYENKEKKSLYVKYEDFNWYLDNIIKIYWKNITLENFPFCQVNEFVYNNIIKRQIYNNDAFWYLWENLEESSTMYIEKCKKCEYKSFCAWIPKDYLQIFNIGN